MTACHLQHFNLCKRGRKAMADAKKPEAKKIDPFDVGALEKSLNDSATRVSTIWVSFLLFGLYLFTTAGTVTHRQLFLKDSIKLPVLNIDLPFLGFWLLAPTLFVVFHAYVLIQVLLLARTAAAYNEAVDRTVGNDTYQAHIRQRLANTLFAQIFAGAPRERLGPLGLVLKLMAWATLAIAPFFILLTFELKFLPHHSQLVTWVHRLLIAADLFALFLLWPAALDARRNIGSWSVCQYLINGAVVVAWACLCVLMISFPGEPHARWLMREDKALTVYSGIQLRNAGTCQEALAAWLFPSNFDRLYVPRESFVEDDKLIKFNTANRQRALRPYQGERSRNLRYRNLNCGTFEGSDLRRADFEGARLIGANLKEAGLHGALLARARLHGASLDKAQLQESSLKHAQLQGASLNSVQLQGASLQGASLNYARLQGASLDSAQLQGASLDSAQLQGVSLALVNLQGASLKDTRLSDAILSGTWIWRARGATCANARVTDPKNDAVIAVGGTLKPIPANPHQIEKFVTQWVAEIPEERGKEKVRNILRERLTVATDDTAALGEAWHRCESESRTISREEFDHRHVAVLRGVVCGAGSDGAAVGRGIARNWISKEKDRREFSVKLAKALLGEDDELCAPAKDYDKGTQTLLREAAGPPPPAAAPAPK
jgi:uncharacterized protein YjbI with pentapeptide repeats